MTKIEKAPRSDKILEVLSVITSAAPALGGPVSAILNGYVTNRKFQRMATAVLQLAGEISAVERNTAESYVATEDFEDLMDDTLRRIAVERQEAKRVLLAHFLAINIRESASNYDELDRILRVLDSLQPAHVLLMRALDQAPDYGAASISGSPIQTLKSRLPQFDEALIKDLVQQLNDLRLADLRSVSTMMTAQGAQELQSTFTPFGRRLMKYIEDKP